MTQPANNADQFTASSIELLKSLVAFDSVSHRSNLPLLAFIRETLAEHGVECEILPSPDGTKGNLLARIGPEVEGGIILSGHSDVVPVEGQPWSSDPFVLTPKRNKLYGRGTSDMKSFIAVCLAFVPEFVKLNLEKPLYFAFSYDEEVGCLGVPHLLKHADKKIPKPWLAIIGEPTEMKVVTAHKGVLSYETVVTGLEWHSSQPHYGVNAVQVAAKLVQYLSDTADACRVSGPQDARFDPPHTTVHVGVIHGGTARNIIPRECTFNWEIRPLPSDDPDAIFARFEEKCSTLRADMQRVFPAADIVTRPMSRMTGVTLPAHAASAAQLVMRCAQSNREHAVSFGTEAGVFHDHGIPAIVCGPGSIQQAHKPDEFIETSQIRACVEFMLRLCDTLTPPHAAPMQ